MLNDRELTEAERRVLAELRILSRESLARLSQHVNSALAERIREMLAEKIPADEIEELRQAFVARTRANREFDRVCARIGDASRHVVDKHWDRWLVEAQFDARPADAEFSEERES